MIAKLKLKFVIINLMMVTAVMLIAFYCNYTFTQNKMYNESIQSLERTISSRTPDDLTSIYIFVDNKGIIHKQPGYDNFEPDESVATALESSSDIGSIKSSDLRFLKQKSDYGIHIAFRSTVEETVALKNLMKFSTITTCGCVVVFLLISIYLAHLATEPIAETFEKQKQLVADASHELKTPITAIIASSDVVLADESINEEAKTWIKSIKSSAEDMSYLVKNMLTLANTDDSNNKLSMSTLNLTDLVMTVALNYEAVFYENNKAFTYHADDNLFISGNENSLKQLVKILLDNAGKYSDKNGSVSLSLNRNDDKAIISVFNTGVPIPQDEIPKIFERFYRVDKARTTITGSGLGLSIAKRIAEDHLTKIGVTSNEQGTCFSIEFKLAKNQ